MQKNEIVKAKLFCCNKLFAFSTAAVWKYKSFLFVLVQTTLNKRLNQKYKK